MIKSSSISKNIILVVFSLVAGFVLGGLHTKYQDIKSLAQIQKLDDKDASEAKVNMTRYHSVDLKSCEQGGVIEENSTGALVDLSCTLTNDRTVKVQFPIFLSNKKAASVKLESCKKIPSTINKIDLLSCELTNGKIFIIGDGATSDSKTVTSNPTTVIPPKQGFLKKLFEPDTH